MLNKRHNPVATFFILLTLVGVSKPAKALSVAQNDEVIISISEALPEETQIKIANSKNIDSSRSLTNVAQKPDVNFDLEDSGRINSDLEDSGSVYSNLEDSGQINFDAEGSKDIESGVNLEDSGQINPDLEDSGSVEPDLQDSGQTISFEVDSSVIIADADDNLVAPNEVEENEIATTKEGQWWWWLPLIIGIPVIAAVLISSLGRKKGDQEPAIDNVQDLNSADRGIGVSGTSGRENLSAIGAVGNQDQLDNPVSTSANSIGAATIVEGTTTSIVNDHNRTEDNLDLDLDIDRSDLEDTDSVAEIPSTSISEFTGYETKLQDNDIDLELIDDIPPINPIDNVAASELVVDLDIEETATGSTGVDNETAIDTKLDTNTVEPPSNLSIDTSDRHGENTFSNVVESDAVIEDVEATEFRGDFVLQEETQEFASDQQADEFDLDITETNQIDDLDPQDARVSGLDSSQSDVAVSEADSEPKIIVESQQDIDVELATSQETIEEPIFDDDLDLEQSNHVTSSSEAALDAAAPELFTESDSQPRLDSGLIDEQNNEIVDRLDLAPETESNELDSKSDVAVSEANSEPYIVSKPQQDRVELSTNQEITEVIGFDSVLDSEPTQTNLNLDELDSTNGSQQLDESDRLSEETIDDNFEVVDFSIEEIGFDNSTPTTEESLDEVSLNEISFNDDNTPTTDASLDEISLNEISLNDSTSTTDASLDEISLDEISFDDSTSTTDASLDEISLDEISFDDTTPTTEASLDEVSLDEISFNDLELDEISFNDDSSSTTDKSLEEVSSDNNQIDSSNEVNNSNLDKDSYEKLNKARANLTLDLLSNSTAGINSLSDDEFDDMNNITEWLESLETPKQNTDNILEWLDSLNTEDTDSMPDARDREEESEEIDDVSFQFIEDLLESDDPNQENK